MENVLIIDDEKEIGLLLRAMLLSLGKKAEHKENLQEGLLSFQESKHDLVFLDLNLPDGLGFSIVPELKSLNKDVKIIIISAMDGEEERARADKLGIDDYITKPFDRERILKAIRA